MTQTRALWIAGILVIIWAGWAIAQAMQAAPARAAARCEQTVARQIAEDQYQAGVAQPWETAETITRPAGAGYFVRVTVTAYPAQGDPYTVNYVCEGAGQSRAVMIGAWTE